MILDKIAQSTYRRVQTAKEIKPERIVREDAEAMSADTGFLFEKALSAPGMSFICEVKKASPSKGVIAREFPYLDIAQEYERSDADAISVLTEPEYFLGSDEYLREIARIVDIPILRKDFIVDDYQIYEAKILGAAAVLLICALLDEDTLARYIRAARSLGLCALVEAHTADEVRMAANAGASIIGVNNRDLQTFAVDIRTSERLAAFIPDGALFVSESGIHTPEDVRLLAQCGADAVLVGETLMRAEDKRKALSELRNYA